MKRYFLGFLVISLMYSCGPSAEDVANIERAAQQELLRQQKIAEQQQELKNMLIELKSRLAGEEQKLQSIEEFHLLRTADEKAQQVADQTKVIEVIKSKIEEVQAQITN
jgi:hypothetical protein